MNSNKKLIVIIALLELVFISFLAFVIPFNQTPTFWIGYLANILAILLFCAGLATISGKKADDAFLSLSPFLMLYGYLAVQGVISLILIVFNTIPIRIAVIACAIPLLTFSIYFIATLIGKNYISGDESYTKEKKLSIALLLADMEAIEAKCSDQSLKKKVHSLSESIRYSDPMSSDKLFPLEKKIEHLTAELDMKINDDDSGSILAICDEIDALLVEREKKCRMLK